MKLLKTNIGSINIRIGIVLALLFCFYTLSFGQDKGKVEVLTKEELKLQRLVEKVQRAQLKVDKYQAKVNEADSIILNGKDMRKSGGIQMAFILDEENKFIKNQNKEIKRLGKALKKADEEEVKEIYAQIKLLDSEFKTKTRELDKKINSANKKIDRGYYAQQKGQDKLKQYKIQLKEAQKDLILAEEQLKSFQKSMDLANN